MKDWITQIRKSPADFNQLLQNLFENILESCLENPVFELEFHPGNKVTLKITGIDTRKFRENLHQMETTDDLLNNSGLRLLIALNADFSIAVEKAPYLEVRWGKKGEYEMAGTTSWEEEANVRISYTLDEEIFKDAELTPAGTDSFLRQFASLHPEVTIKTQSSQHS